MVSSVVDLSVGGVDAGLEGIEVAEDLDGISFAAGVGVNPVPAWSKGLTGVLGSKVEVQARAGGRFFVLTSGSFHIIDSTLEVFELN